MEEFSDPPETLLDQKSTLEDLLQDLRRRNLRWRSQSPFMKDDIEKIVCSDPNVVKSNRTGSRYICYSQSMSAGGSIGKVCEKIKKLAALPFFFRLNYIRQLSTTSLSVNLDASHNRLAHSLGTTDTAAVLLEAINTNGRSVGDLEKTAILLLAFIHDSYHGPFGHTLDLLRDVLWYCPEERVDKFLLKEAVQRSLDALRENKKKEGDLDPLMDAVLTFVADRDSRRAHNILRNVLAILDSQPKEKNYGCDIVDSLLDADRLDYLWRDSKHLIYRTRFKSKDLNDIARSARAIKPSAGGNERLHLDSKYKSKVEELLQTRRIFYRQYYESPQKNILDEMLAHAVYYALVLAGVPIPLSKAQGETDSQLANEFSLLVDSDLLGSMFTFCSRPQQVISLFLLQDLSLNRPFQEVTQRGIPLLDQLGDICTRYHHVMKARSQATEEMAASVDNLTSRQCKDAAKELKSIMDGIIKHRDEDTGVEIDLMAPPTEKLFWLQSLYGNSFRKKAALEKVFWKRLFASSKEDRKLIDYAFTDLVSRLVNNYQRQAKFRGEAFSEQKQKLLVTFLHDHKLEIPLVFLSLNWIPYVDYKDLLAHCKGFHEEEVRFYDSSGESPVVLSPDKCEIEFPLTPSDEDYIVVVSAPDVFFEYDGLKEAIEKSFDDFVNSCEWAYPPP